MLSQGWRSLKDCTGPQPEVKHVLPIPVSYSCKLVWPHYLCQHGRLYAWGKTDHMILTNLNNIYQREALGCCEGQVTKCQLHGL